MSGLIVELNATFDASNVTAQIEAQAAKLRQVIDAVRGLAAGPAQLTQLEGAIGSLSMPTGLDGVAQLLTGLGGVRGSLPGDLSSFLEPLLGPLGSVSVRIDARAQLGGPMALVELLRRALELTTQRVFSGAAPAPLDPKLWGRRGMASGEMAPALLRARIEEATAKLETFGPKLDGPKLIDLLLRAAPAVVDLRKYPSIPVAGEVLEVLETLARWRSMNSEQLTLRLVADLDRIARLIETPRTKVAAPVLEQARTAGASTATLTSALAVLDPLLARLQTQITVDFAQPSNTDLRAMEEQVAALERLANAVQLDGSPLARIELLPKALELELARVVRTLMPAYDPSLVTNYVDDLLAGIPQVEASPFAELIGEFERLDTSFLTNPMRHVRDAVDEAVNEAKAALQTVEQALRGQLAPIADGLDAARQAAKLDELRAALEGLPALVSAFFETHVRGALQPLREAIEAAVAAIADAADGFDPQALVAPLAQTMAQVSAKLKSDEVQNAFAQVEAALQSALEVVEQIELGAAADEVVQALGGIEKQLAALDPSTIPEPAQPVVKQAVDEVARIDFTGEVVSPLLAELRKAMEAGPQALLVSLESAMAELETAIERFRPSVAIGAQIDAPFNELMELARGFKPSALLERVNAAMSSLAARANVLKPGEVLAPLLALHAELTQALASLRPSKLLEPVEAKIAAAIKQVFDAARIDDAFDGIDAVLGVIRQYMVVLDATRAFLDRLSALLSEPGTVEQALDDLVESTLARLDPIALSRLSASFARMGAAVASVEATRLTSDLANALELAGQNTLAGLRSPQAARLSELADNFPLLQLRGAVATPARSRLIELVKRLRLATKAVQSASGAWVAEGPQFTALALDFQSHMQLYARLGQMDGAHVFRDFASAPADIAELKERIRGALREGLELPVTAVFGLYTKVAPIVAALSTDFSKLLAAANAKLDSLAGEEGVGGMVRSIEEAADLLRNFDLAPLRVPLDEVWARVEAALAALNPEPLRAALDAAAAGVAGLLNVSTLIPPEQIASLDAAYAGALKKLDGLAPSAVISAALDPAFDALLGNVKPLLAMPAQLRLVLDGAGATLEAEVTEELARVEVAFDAMLHAIPFGGGSNSVSVSVSASASVG